jgi:serine/threonine protein kinase
MKTTKIWIEDKWYIAVDEQGYVEGPCFEGMLGCVLQVKSTPDDLGEVAVMALKIPRLLADTIEENAYICKLTEDEEAAVRKIIQAGGTVEGLVPAEIYAADSLKKPLTTDHSSDDDAFAQRGHMIFVSFQRDRKPRLCSVKLTDKSFDIIPEGSRVDFQANVSTDDWKNFLQASRDGRLEFSEPVYSSREATKSNQSGPLRNALIGRQTKVWYAALPSIVFHWAGGTLQETITKREIGHWTLKDHFSLFGQILQAVRFLHKLGMIHGDIRPANVMWMGEALASKYRLGDYGSYGREWQVVSRQEPAGGFTMVGPAIGQRRHTVFYSPERRAGNEFESADTAVITRAPEDGSGITSYVILLGWRSGLLMDGKVTDLTRKLMSEWASSDTPSEQDNQPNLDELQKGDRLRLRNYLFEVKRSQQIGNANQKIFLCSGRYAEVLHDSLVVYSDTELSADGIVLDLSNYVELHQWSAASDLFSVGAVCLYSLFCGGLQKAPQGNDRAIGNPDRLFLEMIEVLESVPCFGFLWDEMESFREEIEALYSRDPSSKDAPEAKIIVPPRDGEDISEAKEQTLRVVALNATNSILKITPRAKILLEAFQFNLAYFLLFMHFVLACLHRKSHMSAELSSKAKSKTGFHTPFTENRIEPPMPEGAAEKALGRLETLDSYLNQPFFKGFTGDRDAIIDYDPRSNFQVRMDLNKRLDEINELRKQVGTLTQKNVEKSGQIRDLNREKNELHQQLAVLTSMEEENSIQIMELSRDIENLRGVNTLLKEETSRLSEQSQSDFEAVSKVTGLPAWRIVASRRAINGLKVRFAPDKPSRCSDPLPSKEK